jgi:hypothetical protein
MSLRPVSIPVRVTSSAVPRVVGAARAERRYVRFTAILAIGLLLVSSIPYVYGYLSSPPDQQFMGLVYAFEDYGQYRSWARESAQQILVANKLTPEPGSPVFFNLFWWVIGRAQALTGASFNSVNQVVRLISGGLYVAVAAWFCAVMFRDQSRRRFALVLSCFSAGFGWVLALAGQILGSVPAPLLVHNFLANSFFSIMSVPHHLFAAALLLAVLLLVLRSYQQMCGRRMAVAGLLALLLGFAHTYDLVLAWAVVAAFGLAVVVRDGIRRRWIFNLGLFYALSLPAPIFWFSLSLGDPDWRAYLDQFKNLGVFTPDPLGLIVLLGPTLVVAALTYRGLVPLADRRDEDLLLTAWFLVNLVIIYLPVNFQVMMLNGFQVALAVLATQGLFDDIVPWVQQRLATVNAPERYAQLLSGRMATLVTIALFMATMVPTDLYLLAWRVHDLGRHKYPAYLYRDDVAALDWLDANAGPDSVVLSSSSIGGYVPGWTGGHAVLAHGAATLNFYMKRAAVDRFFGANTSDEERQRILRDLRARFVFHGPAERELGQFQPSSAGYLRLVFDTPRTQVYEVIQLTSFSTGIVRSHMYRTAGLAQ